MPRPILLLILAAAVGWPQQVKEASGVTRLGSSLLVADDALNGAYWDLRWNPDLGPIFALNSLKAERRRLRRGALGVDLESIALMSDGRVALLSERLRSLVTREGIIAEYNSELAEAGKRGLEGLAVRTLPDGASRVAVLWEGGYPDFGEIPRGRDHGPWKPLIVVHDIPPGGKVGRVHLNKAVAVVELEAPLPDTLAPPVAQRFRAPDMTWYLLNRSEWGFLVLLSSQDGTPKPQFRYKWLQRFNSKGAPVGEPLDLLPRLPENLRDANWEGLDWWEQGRSVILVHEAGESLEAHGWILDLPDSWRFDP